MRFSFHKNFTAVLISSLLTGHPGYCETRESPEAQEGKVVEDNANNRIFTSIRLKVEVLQEIFFSSNPSYLENCELENDLDSEPEENALATQTTEDKNFMKVDVAQIDEEWHERYVEGLDPQRQTELLDDVNFKMALVEGTEQREIEVEIIDRKERNHPAIQGVSYVDKKTNARMQLQVSFKDDEEEREVFLQIRRPDGSIVERYVDLSSETLIHRILANTSQTRTRMYDIFALQAMATLAGSSLVMALGAIEGSMVIMLIGMGGVLMTFAEAGMAAYGRIYEIIDRVCTKRYRPRIENLSEKNLSGKELRIPHKTFKTLERILLNN